MALNLGFGSSKGSQTGMQKTEQSQSQVGSEKQFGTNVTTTLDQGTISTLQGIIQSIAPNVGSSVDADTIRALSGQLATNLDPALVEANIQASQAAAVRNFNLNQGAQIANFQQLIGSKGNTFAQQIQQQGNVDLATMLAQIDSNTRLQAAGQRSQDLSGAIQGTAAAGQVQQQPLNQLLAAIATLSGAQTTQQVDMNNLTNLVSNLTSRTDTTQSSKSRGFSLGFTGGE